MCNAGQTLTYEIVSGNGLGIFALSTDGQITVANNNNLDYEQHTQVNLVVRVTDDGSPVMSSEATINININDVNEPPVFTSADNANLNHNQTLTHTLTATDPENNPLTFSGNSLPAWISLSGDQLSITPSYANIGTHQIELVVSDGTNQVTQQFTITVNEANVAPVISDQAFSVDENSANGTVVGQAAASDENAGQTLTYSIVSGNNLGIFALSTDGQITIADNANLDHEQHAQVDLIIRVTDSGSPALNAEATVTININDINETPVIGNQTMSVVSGNDLNIFKLSSDGELSINDATNLDYEANPNVDLVIKVTDSATPALESQATVTVNILDVDDEAPTLTISVSGPVTITQGDSFTVPDATCNDNQSSCTIAVDNPVDVNTIGTYYLTYTASDAAGNRVVAQVEVRVVARATPDPEPNPTPVPVPTPNPVPTEIVQPNNYPPFELNPEIRMEIYLGDPYIEPGFKCHPNVDCMVEIIGKVDINKPGTYTLTYKHVKTGYRLTRTVVVKEKPQINETDTKKDAPLEANEQKASACALGGVCEFFTNNCCFWLWMLFLFWILVVVILLILLMRCRKQNQQNKKPSRLKV